MADRAIVTAPSRLHFGMVSIGRSGERQFGGLGVMLERPGIQLRVSRADALQATGPLSDRALAFAKRFCDAARWTDTNFLLEVLGATRDHVGLGVGTQLALAVASGITTLAGSSTIDAVRCSELVGRGERSAIGTYGFQSGGLLLDAGKLPSESVSPWPARIDFPPAWRFVLIVPKSERGVHGMDERHVFGELLPTPTETSRRLFESAENLMQSAAASDFAAFSEELYQFNRAAGELFARYQQGAYANERVRRLVEKVRDASIAGAGQSSWGPAVFALTADETSAQNLVEYCQSLTEADNCEVLVSAAQNSGVRISLE
jgi:beta-RFAP synthase